MARRDPASELLDGAARRLISHALGSPGQWQSTRLADPGPQSRQILSSLGINWRGPDNASARGGRGLNARDRWGRAMVRALYHQFRYFSPVRGGTWRGEARAEPRHTGALRVEVGARLPAVGVIPAG